MSLAWKERLNFVFKMGKYVKKVFKVKIRITEFKVNVISFFSIFHDYFENGVLTFDTFEVQSVQNAQTKTDSEIYY